MFIFIYKKTCFDVVIYRWDIVEANTKIGAITLIIRPTGNELMACFPPENIVNYPESYIKQLMEEFKSLANNYLLDIDEDYEPFSYIEADFTNGVIINY